VTPSSKKKWFYPVVLTVLAFWIILQRLHTYNEPLDRDLTLYAVFGHELLAGRLLYTDLWDNKPPFIHLIYALAELIAGYGPGSIFLLNVTAAIVSLIGVFRAGTILGGHFTGLWAAFLWALVSGDLNLEANQPNTEVFMNASFIWFFVLWLPLRKKKSTRQNVTAGLLMAAATLFKPVMIFPVLTIVSAGLVMSLRDVSLRKDYLRRTCIAGFSAAILWAAVVGYFAIQHRLQDFMDAVFRFNYFFTGQKTPLYQRLFTFDPQAWQHALQYGFLNVCGPLILLGLIGFGLKIRRPETSEAAGWWLAYMIGAYFAITSPGFMLAHYFQLGLPVAVLGAAMTISQIQGEKIAHTFKISWGVGCVMVAALLAIEVPFYRLSAEEWSRKKFNGGEFIRTRQIGEEIRQRLGPDKTFYNWGWETGLYYYSKKSPPTGVLFNNVLQGGPLAVQLSSRVLKDLQTAPPDLLVLTRWSVPAADETQPVAVWLRKNYKPLEARADEDPFVFFVRRDAKLGDKMRERS
jgi:hypothetical protein